MAVSNKLEAKMVKKKKNPEKKEQMKELKETRHKTEPIFFWVTDNGIINHFSTQSKQRKRLPDLHVSKGYRPVNLRTSVF